MATMKYRRRRSTKHKGALGFGERETVTGAEEDGAGACPQECSDNAFTKENDIRRCHRCFKEHRQDFHPKQGTPAASKLAGGLTNACRSAPDCRPPRRRPLPAPA